MELKATALGKHLARHPYDRIELLAAGVRLSGERHEYLLPFNQILDIHCKRGLVWGEMEFSLAQGQVVRLHGTQWQQTQHFWQHLYARWQQWSQQMSEIAANVLQNHLARIQARAQQEHWISYRHLTELRQALHTAVNALPLPEARLDQLDNCRPLWQQCQHWLEHTESWRFAHNQAWLTRAQQQHADFFNTAIMGAPPDSTQIKALINGEDAVLTLAGAGTGKTALLAARAGWLLAQHQARAEQILPLSTCASNAQQLAQLLARYQPDPPASQTFHSLALHIIQQSGKHPAKISPFEQNQSALHTLLINAWQQQCSEKKSYANAWRRWLHQVQGCPPEDRFWQNEPLARRLAPRLASELYRLKLSQYKPAQNKLSQPKPLQPNQPALNPPENPTPLLAPLLKAWQTANKAENALDFLALAHQAINLLDSGRFISPWKHILIDDFQDLTPAHLALLSALRRQNTHSLIFATGDDWQTLTPHTRPPQTLINRFKQHFGSADICILDTSHRLNARVADIARQLIRHNFPTPPQAPQTPLNALTPGDKKSLCLLEESQLTALLDKLSGYALAEQRILLLARYPHLRPAILEHAATRWPTLNLSFLTIQQSRGQQADYCILLGLNSDTDGLPAQSPDLDLLPAALAPRAEPKAKIEPKTETEINPKTKSKPEPKTKTKTTAGIKSGIKSEITAATQSGTKAGIKSETKARTKSEIKAQAGIKAGIKAGITAETQSETQSETQAETQFEIESKLDLETQARRLLYLALTRARLRTWLLYNKHQPSTFITELKHLGVPALKKP